MPKLLVEVRAPDLLPPLDLPLPPADRAALSLTDRASLRLGLWLLLRSTRRARNRTDHDSHSRLVANERDRLDRDQAKLRLRNQWPQQ
ncbi:hypothetical protein LG299_02855 [Microbacterium lacus]|uniref:hypothetical protein n=1 Tax=Microbacterium lacus TaxID=415217 RepID=UPI00384B8E80